MSDEPHRTESPARDLWLEQVLARIQIGIGRVVCARADDAPVVVTTLAGELPTPANHADAMHLRSLLSDFSAHCGEFIHTRAHPRPVRCDFLPQTVHYQVWHRADSDPRAVLSTWANAFFPTFSRAHPPSLAEHVARLLAREYHCAWTDRRLARQFHVSAAALRRAFEAEHGVSVRDYHRTLRVLAAVERLRIDKVEAVALEVGFKSRKNLYRALRQLARLTPSQFRALSAEEAAALFEELRLALVRNRAP